MKPAAWMHPTDNSAVTTNPHLWTGARPLVLLDEIHQGNQPKPLDGTGLLDLDAIKAEFARVMLDHHGGMDEALLHVAELAYRRGAADEAARIERNSLMVFEIDNLPKLECLKCLDA